jgi:hypothetical protein
VAPSATASNAARSRMDGRTRLDGANETTETIKTAFQSWLGKSSRLRVHDFVRNMRSINLFKGIHINLVARRGSRIVKGFICFSALLLTTAVRWSHCSLVCALSNLEFAAFGRFCFMLPR